MANDTAPAHTLRHRDRFHRVTIFGRVYRQKNTGDPAIYTVRRREGRWIVATVYSDEMGYDIEQTIHESEDVRPID